MPLSRPTTINPLKIYENWANTKYDREALRPPRIPSAFGPNGIYGPASINAYNAGVAGAYYGGGANYGGAAYGVTGYGGSSYDNYLPAYYNPFMFNPYVPSTQYIPPRSWQNAATNAVGTSGTVLGTYDTWRPRPFYPEFVEPPKVRDKDYKRVWVRVSPPKAGTRVFMTDAPIMGTNPHARVLIDLPRPPDTDHQAESGPSNAVPSSEDFSSPELRRSEHEPSEYSAVTDVFLTPPSRLRTPVPGGEEEGHVALEEFVFPPKYWRPYYKRPKKKKTFPDKNYGVNMSHIRRNKADDSEPPDTVPIPLAPRVVARRSHGLERVQSGASHLSDSHDGANDDMVNHDSTPTTVAEVVAERPSLDLSPHGEFRSIRSLRRTKSRADNSASRPLVVAKESDWQRFKKLFQPIEKEPKAPKIQPPIREVEPPKRVIPPHTAIVHTRRRLFGKDTPLTAEESELARAVAESQLDDVLVKKDIKGKGKRLRSSSSASSRRDGTKSNPEPERGTLIPADVLPLPKAVAKLRPKSFRGHTEPGKVGSPPAVSSPLASVPPISLSEDDEGKPGPAPKDASAGSPAEETLAELGVPKPDPPVPFVARPLDPNAPTIPKALMKAGIIKTPPTSPRLVPVRSRSPRSTRHSNSSAETFVDSSPPPTHPTDTITAVIEQPWADLIALPNGSKVEKFNPIRELNKKYFKEYTEYADPIRVISLPTNVRVPGTKLNTWRKNGIPGTENGPPLRVVELPEELEVEYYEQRMVLRIRLDKVVFS